MTDTVHGEDLIEEGQALAEITANNLYTIAALFGSLEIESVLLAQPGSPTDGNAYIIDGSGSITGADWTSTTATSKHPAQKGDVAFYNQGWKLFRPRGGMLAYDKTNNRLLTYSEQESTWHPLQESWSTTAEFTGKYTANGGAIWAITVEDTAMPNTTTETFDPNVTINFAEVVKVEFRAADDTGSSEEAFSGASYWSDGTRSVELLVDQNSDISVTTDFDASAFRAEYRIEYVPA